MIPLLLIGAAYLIGKTMERETYVDGGKVKLLAPNGLPSKLTPEQYKLVRTPEFKAWFGDWENDAENASHVVDEQTKEPKVMWHGSDYMDEINVFKSNKGHDYNFFSEDRSESHRYIIDFERKYPNEKYNSKLREKYYDSKIKPFFINARKIFDINKINQSEKRKTISFIDKNVDILFDTIIEFMNNNGVDYEEWLYETNTKKNASKTDLIVWLLKNSSDDWWVLETPVFQEYIKENKYDSFVTKESGWYNIAVYEPNQIKLADGSNRTFDGGNPDIRYKDGGMIDKIKSLFLGNGFTEYDLESIIEENPNYFNQIEFYNNETLVVYRTIALPKRLLDKFINLDKKIIEDGIGEYWTLNKNFNRSVWGVGHYKDEEVFDVTCIGNLKINDIDWKMMKYAYKDDSWHFASESEIRGKNGGECIKVISCNLTKEEFGKGGNTKKGDCYVVAGRFVLDFNPSKSNYIGTPYLVHAEVQGQGAVSDLRYGHAWIEDDFFVYDFSNGRELVIPKQMYYRIGDIKIENPKKYVRYTFEEARKKMSSTKNFGFWDLDVQYQNGGTLEIFNDSDIQKIIQIPVLEKFNHDYISNIQQLRHNIHSENVKDIFYDSKSFDLDIESIADNIKLLDITGKENELSKKIRRYSNLEGGDRKFYGGHEFEDEDEEDYIDKAYSEISLEKEAINQIVELYLKNLDKIWDNYNLSYISDIRGNKTFCPSGYLRARSILGEGTMNTTKAEKFDNKINEIVSNEYNKAKLDGSNPILVKAVEQKLKNNA